MLDMAAAATLNRVRVRLLGCVDVTVDGVPRPVEGVRRKTILAVLALRAGQIVSADRLIDEVWGEQAPAKALNALQRHVSYLRTVLDVPRAIVSRPPGYILQLAGEPTDVQVAERLIRDAGQVADPARQAVWLREALGLWRDESLAEVRGHGWLEEQAQRLDQLRHSAVRALTGARLELGEHAWLVPELQHLAQRYPYDEEVHRQLMLALHRTGRPADALEAYQRLRCILDEDLGVDPSPPLRDLQAAILRHDPALDPSLDTALGPATRPKSRPPSRLRVHRFRGCAGWGRCRRRAAR